MTIDRITSRYDNRLRAALDVTKVAISNIEGDVTTIEGDISSIDSRVSALEGGASGLAVNEITLGGFGIAIADPLGTGGLDIYVVIGGTGTKAISGSFWNPGDANYTTATTSAVGDVLWLLGVHDGASGRWYIINNVGFALT